MQRLVTGLAVTVLLASAVVLIGVKPAASQPQHPPRSDHAGPAPHADAPMHAIAVLLPTEGSDAEGIITLTQRGDRVTVTGQVAGLTPDGRHAIHIHEFGDISAPDGSSAGSHYNPEGHEHALPNGDHPRHAGDMGNLEADGDGVATIDQTFDNFTIAGPTNPVLGRAIVVHEKEDDGGQPVGNAGGRIALGVIGVAQAGND